MKKIFLDELPNRKGNTHQIDWKNSIGYKVKFIYDNIDGEIEIIDYYIKNNKGYLKTKYNKKVLEIRTDTFFNCRLNKIIYETFTEKYVLKGYNDLWTTHPEIAKLLKYPEQGYEISFGTHKSEIFICPDCGYEKSFIINNIIRRGFSCPKCGDGISYPEKIMFNVLEQLINQNIIISFKYQYKLKTKKLDFYFELNNKKYAIETDGLLGHGNKNMLTGQSAKETQEIDDYKDRMAKEHNIEVIRIDCKESNLEYIKNNIIHKLNKILNLDNIDWLKCHKFACKSLVKIACDLWNDGIKDTLKIANDLKISRGTTIRYLKQGNQLNLCNYDSKQNLIDNGKKNKKQIIQLTIQNKFIKKWDSILKAEKELHIKNISMCCTGKLKTAGGFKWMYKEDYDEYIKQQNKSA